MSQPVIETTKLSVYYGRQRGIVDVDLRVNEGEIFGFLGPNGAGKTTTQRVLLDIIRPTAGEARMFGLDCQKQGVQARRRVGYLPGELALYGSMRASQFFDMYASLQNNAAARATWKALAERLDLDASRRIRQLSRGNRQKVGIVAAFMSKPDLLILDEPTSGLDPLMQQTVMELVREASKAGATVFFSSHILPEVQAVCDRVGIIRAGALVATERVEELLQLRYDSGEERVAIALAGRRLGKQVLAAHRLSKGYAGQAVVDGVDFDLAPGDRVGIIGPNGAGKSTLLDILAGKTVPDGGAVRWGDTVQIGYYDQRSEDLNDQQRVIEFIQDEAPLILTKDGERVEAAQMLEWFLFPRPMQWARIGSLSGGERRRLYLLRTLIHQPNVLFLDEPTNDLDIQTLTVLEEFLDHFAGCLVVVSHDRYFLDRTVDYLVSMEDGRLGPRLPAPYSTFVRLRDEADRASAQPAAPARDKGSATAIQPRADVGQPLRKLTWKEQKELEALEAAAERLEATQAALLAEMNGCGDDYVRLQGLAAQLQGLDADLEATLARWLELSEIAEHAPP